ncbi:MAG: hypothetical protein KAJ18_05685 [Candidatus Omnitrophica bacterium]|nr:hypothetical protein [Candidatus Omnitrophota bacterium]
MRRVICLSLVMLLFAVPAFAFSDAWAILQQTVIQTAEHVKRLQQSIVQVQTMKSQLQLAVEASKGFDGVSFISDFRNMVIETNDLLADLDSYISDGADISVEWKDIFGSLDGWVDTPKSEYENIAMADDVNSASYKVADTFQDTYKRNSQYAAKFIAHSKGLNEKGALKQIAEELGHLMQMQNQVIYLLSQSVKQQSIESSNQNTKRKEAVIELEQENSGVRRFISSADNAFDIN